LLYHKTRMLTKNKIFLYIFVADIIFVIHFLLVLSVVFSWLFPKLFVYFLVLWTFTFISEILFGRCVLTNWEFDLRRKIFPDSKYEKSCMVHYYRKLFGLEIRENREQKEKTILQKNSFKIILIVLLAVSLVYNLVLL
jgi:hypothetical protein